MQTFYIKTKVCTGDDAMQVLGTFRDKNAVIFTDAFMVKSGTADRIAKMLTGCRKADTVLAIGPISQREYNGKTYVNMDADFVIVAGENSGAAGNFAAVAEMAKSVAPVGGYAPNVSAADWPEMDEGDDGLPF